MKIERSKIGQTGLFVLYQPEFPLTAAVDVVFIHGLKGHPRTTWETPDAKCFWPLDLLPASLEAGDEEQQQRGTPARIVSLGYDTVIARGDKAAAQDSVFSIAKVLLLEYANDRDKNGIQGRPVVFVTHGFGGVIVKEMLRLADHEGDANPRTRDVLRSTFGLVFLGTPHRGSLVVDHGDLVRATASQVLGLDPTDQRLRTLVGADDAELDVAREAFLRLWGEYNFAVVNFEETKALASIAPLTRLIVPTPSSSTGDDREHNEQLEADHFSMTQFADAQDAGYQKVSRALAGLARDAAARTARRLSAQSYSSKGSA